MRFRFVTVSHAHFFGIAHRTLDGKAIYVTDREKTLLDAAARPDLSGGTVQLAQALLAAHTDVDWVRLDSYLDRWGGGVVVKRLGYLVEVLALPIPDSDHRMQSWQELLSSGHLPPGAGANARGPVATTLASACERGRRHPRGVVWMIAEAEIRRCAARWRVDPMVADLDYGLGWFLAAITLAGDFAGQMLFKGGTCLRKCYFEDYRFSEDLDFTATEYLTAETLMEWVGARHTMGD